ncbi:alpha-amylase family glycosyl hydrolase [Dictyobacter kobayashii]|uniref:Amylosucrase n=1 Tax=Dictyobacter kobayashii TaxID=2014872 RepID=A0A402AT26_9CHLR|nr:alpha-amylase family glycosyl hydrolase [Dictyobacter kobayashii]GCE22276.1 amylosucrase [Dictyobacter kobayashii]
MTSSQGTWPILHAHLLEIFKDNGQSTLFLTRLEERFARLSELLFSLYGDRADFTEQLERICTTAAHAFIARSPELHALDASRNPDWFQQASMVGGVCYVDRYAGNLAGIRARIPYFQELGLTYLHLMPLFAAPESFNDGGYAVSDFRAVRPQLGTMAELADLASELRAHGISLVLDMVMNHTSDEHEWALRAREGDQSYQDYYRMFPDDTIPKRYEQNLREIFPAQAPGNFTYVPEVQRWVWTTFHNYQWDLNYANPALFNAMLDEMLFLANQGVEVLRIDAVPFLWKELGTNCENLPQAHAIVEALNLLIQIVAPATIFKAEAIVHPDEIARYIGPECAISYNPLLMVLLWEALASGWTHLLQHSMVKRFAIPTNTAWVNYIRSHDDIGWGFADEDCAEVGIDGGIHRIFLNRFYTGQVEGSFAAGLPFGYNPRTGDMRISGTTASLAGLEKAQHSGDPYQLDLAIRRILAMMGIILTAGGIPLFYLGDELGTLNDYSYQHDITRTNDSRWVHRPAANQDLLAQRHDPTTVAGRIFGALQRMIALRKSNPIFGADQPTQWLNNIDKHTVLFVRQQGLQRIYVAANFSAYTQSLDLRQFVASQHTTDLLTERRYARDEPLTLAPYEMVWLHSDGHESASIDTDAVSMLSSG